MKNFKKARCAFGAGAVALSFAAGGMAPKANAATGIYLTGAAEYVTLAESGGSDNYFTYYRHTTNSTDLGHGSLPLTETSPAAPTQSSAISFELALGDNTFTTPSIDSILSADRNAAIELFFNDTGVSYNPTNSTGPGIPGNLAVWAPAGTSAFQTPTAGTQILDYLGAAASGPDAWLASYSGATVFTIDTYFKISITAFTAGDNTATASEKDPGDVIHNDTVTIHLEALPEPASLGILGLGGLMLLRRRR